MTKQLNSENYHDEKMNKKFLSNSNFKDYLDDPALFYMKMNNEFDRTISDALVAGTLFHAFMESEEEFERVIEKHQPDIFNSRSKTINKDKSALDFIHNGEIEKLVVRAPATFSDIWNYILDNWHIREMIWTPEKNEEREKILTGEIAGVPFKGKADRLFLYDNNTRALIYDYKTIALRDNYGRYYDVNEKRSVEQNFLHQYGYDMQMYIYKRLVSQMYEIPMDKIAVQLGLFIKSGKTAFVEYEGGFIETEELTDEDLFAPRLFGGMNVADIIDKEAKNAYDLMNAKELPANYAKKSVFYNMKAKPNQRVALPVNSFKLP